MPAHNALYVPKRYMKPKRPPIFWEHSHTLEHRELLHTPYMRERIQLIQEHLRSTYEDAAILACTIKGGNDQLKSYLGQLVGGQI